MDRFLENCRKCENCATLRAIAVDCDSSWTRELDEISRCTAMALEESERTLCESKDRHSYEMEMRITTNRGLAMRTLTRLSRRLLHQNLELLWKRWRPVRPGSAADFEQAQREWRQDRQELRCQVRDLEESVSRKHALELECIELTRKLEQASTILETVQRRSNAKESEFEASLLQLGQSAAERAEQLTAEVDLLREQLGQAQNQGDLTLALRECRKRLECAQKRSLHQAIRHHQEMSHCWSRLVLCKLQNNWMRDDRACFYPVLQAGSREFELDMLHEQSEAMDAAFGGMAMIRSAHRRELDAMVVTQPLVDDIEVELEATKAALERSRLRLFVRLMSHWALQARGALLRSTVRSLANGFRETKVQRLRDRANALATPPATPTSRRHSFD
eukprot:TRINITY_DN49923_c0_g1_i1.p1 TRINITY_DN49923_c0_g1~~TRINITY_DN49923_c0_g1_i1.p1  ORF type:complete len:391 (+),score=92.79 TRINITY_DN49923_c0_g1_i1:111-1283(+)